MKQIFIFIQFVSLQVAAEHVLPHKTIYMNKEIPDIEPDYSWKDMIGPGLCFLFGTGLLYQMRQESQRKEELQKQFWNAEQIRLEKKAKQDQKRVDLAKDKQLIVNKQKADCDKTQKVQVTQLDKQVGDSEGNTEQHKVVVGQSLKQNKTDETVIVESIVKPIVTKSIKIENTPMPVKVTEKDKFQVNEPVKLESKPQVTKAQDEQTTPNTKPATITKQKESKAQLIQQTEPVVVNKVNKATEADKPKPNQTTVTISTEITEDVKNFINKQVIQLPRCAEKGQGGVLLPFPYWITLFKMLNYICSIENYRVTRQIEQVRRKMMKNGDMAAYGKLIQDVGPQLVQQKQMLYTTVLKMADCPLQQFQATEQFLQKNADPRIKQEVQKAIQEVNGKMQATRIQNQLPNATKLSKDQTMQYCLIMREKQMKADFEVKHAIQSKQIPEAAMAQVLATQKDVGFDELFCKFGVEEYQITASALEYKLAEDKEYLTSLESMVKEFQLKVQEVLAGKPSRFL